MNQTVARYVPLVDFLETVLSRNSEIVLHDLTDLSHSVVDIRNGHVSGRQVGAPATDFVLKVISGEAFTDRDSTPNYLSHSVTGKPLKSASYFIREESRVVGMLCVNTDTSLVDELVSAAAALARTFPSASEVNPLSEEQGAAGIEHFTASADDLVGRTISEIAAVKRMDPEAFSPADRMETVRKLNNDGVFLLKGAVARVAEILGVSEPSVYRYLQKVKRETN